MGSGQCPICFGFLETRSVSPCYVCGGWSERIAIDSPVKPWRMYRLPLGDTIVLCESCKLDEFMVPKGWGYQMFPNESRPWNVLTPIPLAIDSTNSRDKFCPDCNIRHALAELIVAHKNRDGQYEPTELPHSPESEM